MDDKPVSLSRSNGHARDPAAQRAEIAETRNQMSATIEQLHGRLNPTVFKEQALEQFHEAAETVKEELKTRLHEAREAVIAEIDTVKAKVSDEIVQAKTSLREATIGKVENMMRGVKDTVSANPIPAALAGLGLAWLFIEGRRRSRDDRPQIAAPIEPVEAAKETSVVSDVAHKAKEKAKDLSRTASEQARRVQTRGKELYRDNPIAVGAALLAAGTLLGLVVPRTRLEDEWMGGARDKAVDKAQEVAHQAFEKASDAVKHVGEEEETIPETPGEYH